MKFLVYLIVVLGLAMAVEQTCPDNQEPSHDCNHCSRSCDIPHMACTLMGCPIDGNYTRPCVCKEGFRTTSDGCAPCDKPQQDPNSPSCPENQEPSPDCNSCSRSCENDLMACTLMLCPEGAPKKCVCKEGFHSTENGCEPCKKS